MLKRLPTINQEKPNVLIHGNVINRTKNRIFNIFPGFGKIWSFNRTSRDNWILLKSKVVHNNSRVIDIGAGTCPYKNLFLHCEYISHDFGKLEDVQLQERKGYGDIKIYSDITSIPVDDSSFDVALCTEVLEHVPEPIMAIKEIGRILKPNGILLLSAPLRSALHQMPYHYYGGFTPVWFIKYLNEAGFTDIKIDPVCGIFNFYGEESLRVFIALSPFNKGKYYEKIILLPIWIITFPWLAIVCPIIFFLLDKLNIGFGNTTGYRVEARKK